MTRRAVPLTVLPSLLRPNPFPLSLFHAHVFRARPMPAAAMQITPSLMIDAAEFARLLSVSKPTIWRMRDDGRLPPPIVLTSQCLRWRRDVVLEWINGGCQSPTENSAQVA